MTPIVECSECGAPFRLQSEIGAAQVGHYCNVTTRHSDLPDRDPAPVEVVDDA